MTCSCISDLIFLIPQFRCNIQDFIEKYNAFRDWKRCTTIIPGRCLYHSLDDIFYELLTSNHEDEGVKKLHEVVKSSSIFRVDDMSNMRLSQILTRVYRSLNECSLYACNHIIQMTYIHDNPKFIRIKSLLHRTQLCHFPLLCEGKMFSDFCVESILAINFCNGSGIIMTPIEVMQKIRRTRCSTAVIARKIDCEKISSLRNISDVIAFLAYCNANEPNIILEKRFFKDNKIDQELKVYIMNRTIHTIGVNIQKETREVTEFYVNFLVNRFRELNLKNTRSITKH